MHTTYGVDPFSILSAWFLADRCRTIRICEGELYPVRLQRNLRLSNISLGAIIRDIKERTLIQFHYFETKSESPAVSTAVLCALTPRQVQRFELLIGCYPLLIRPTKD